MTSLLTVIAWFGKDLLFVQLIRNLEVLIDDHTEYFRGHMESLPSKERKVFATLARLWEPSASSDVAREARMEQTETSSLINRLVNRGAVMEFSPKLGKNRSKLYQLTERLYNIYYLMRVGGKYSSWVKPVVEFLAQVYGSKLSEEPGSFDAAKCDANTMKYLTDEFNNPKHISEDIQKITDLCMDIAAGSREMAQSLFKLIENSPSRDVLSPLTAGIKNYLGTEFRAPFEVREIADDIREWIEAKANKKSH